MPSNQIAPYKYVNGSWNKISNYTVDAKACTISFNATGGNVTVAVIYGKLTQQTTDQYTTNLIIIAAGMIIGAAAALLYISKRKR